ncbi:unnamed protein product [Prorocentrum cordatum]|uniref:SP-RING-type domain-containing protein n=1 Tax=Prorocentrum cordatum TaxID=2364126 RepID=A0ABN9UR17_9DINO|nr:unnamed protein product [Polarella glacialis]
MKAMDPFNEVVEPGGVLVCRRLSRGCLDLTLDLPELRQWRRDSLHVEVRMVRPGKSMDLHAWPRRLEVCVNGTLAFGIAPPEEGHKRRDVPEDVSVALRPGENRVSVQAEDDAVEDYVLAVLLTAPRADADLARRVGEVPLDAARDRAVALLGGPTPGEEVECMTSATLKLTCPITMGRVVGPVRGKACRHVQCFGLDAYLAINRQMQAFNSRWCCPVCARVLRPVDLCGDPYVASIAAKAPRDVTDVEVGRDGGWSLPVAAPARGHRHRLFRMATEAKRDAEGSVLGPARDLTPEKGGDVLDLTPETGDVMELDDKPPEGGSPGARAARAAPLGNSLVSPRSAGAPRAVAGSPGEDPLEESSQELLVPAAPSACALLQEACADSAAALGEESSQEVITAAAPTAAAQQRHGPLD